MPPPLFVRKSWSFSTKSTWCHAIQNAHLSHYKLSVLRPLHTQGGRPSYSQLRSGVGRKSKAAVHRLGEAAERASCWLWNRREEFSWGPGGDGQWLATTADPPTVGRCGSGLKRPVKVRCHLMTSSPGWKLQSCRCDWVCQHQCRCI